MNLARSAAAILSAVCLLCLPRLSSAAADDFSSSLPSLGAMRQASADIPALGETAPVPQTMYADVDGVDVLKEPRVPKDDDERESLVLTQLKRGEKVSVIGETDEWYKVKVNRSEWDEEANAFRDYTEGWIQKEVQPYWPQPQPQPQPRLPSTSRAYPQSTPERPSLPEAPVDIDAGSCRAAFIKAAQRFQGVPYVWGGTSHRGVDCSGLVVASLLEANCVKRMPPRVARDQQRAAIPLSGPEQMQPGDLIFHGTPAHHVLIFMGKFGDGYKVIEAPRRGTVVNVHAWQPGRGMTYGALLPRLQQ